MTVNELINILNNIENKEIPVYLEMIWEKDIVYSVDEIKEISQVKKLIEFNDYLLLTNNERELL